MELSSLYERWGWAWRHWLVCPSMVVPTGTVEGMGTCRGQIVRAWFEQGRN